MRDKVDPLHTTTEDGRVWAGYGPGKLAESHHIILSFGARSVGVA